MFVCGILLFFLAASVQADLIEECMNYTIYPLQYELTIAPYIMKDRAFYHCDITIDVIANVPGIQVIELDAKDLVIREDTIKVLYGSKDLVNGARPYEFDASRGKLYIYLREPLQRYDAKTNSKYVYKIRMSFTKQMDDDQSHGLFLVNYYDEGTRETKYAFASRFSPNKAKYAFPCFDNPRFEAGFKFKVYVMQQRPGMQYSNTSLVISEEAMRETTKDHVAINYRPSPQVALHQVGFHLSQFSHNKLKSKHTNDTLRVWAPSNLQNYNFILYYGVNIIDLIHEFSGKRRPLLNGPINVVAVPTKLDGYEISSWNLLTNSDYKLTNIGHLTSIKQLERMKFELAQQLSRLWLGNPGEPQVTRWREQWFKEGVATYLAYYLLAQYNHGSPNANIKRPLDYYGLQMKQQAMAADWLHSTPALTTFNNTLAVEIPSRYKDLVTMKTAAIWWMLENWLENEQLHQSFVKHVNAMRGKYISMWELNGAIDKDTIECTYQFFNGSTPSRILQSWFHQAGYPVVSVNVLRDRTPNAIQLKQRHFSYTGRNNEPTEYLIPISYLLQSSENCFNCHQPRFTIEQTYTFSENLNGGWIILNRNASGYYRVNYDRDTWNLIAASLKQDPTLINEMNRAQIVNDVFALYMAGDMDRLLAEHILSYLDNERSILVWEAAIDGFNMLKIRGTRVTVTKNLYWEWREFMGRRVQRIFSLLIKNNDMSPQTRLFRSNIISFASEINHEPCLKYLRRVYDEYGQGTKRLDPDLREAIFYVFGNSSHTHSLHKKLLPIELEEKLAAENRVREINGFIINCPAGEPRPMPIISTEKPATVSVTEKLEKPLEPSTLSSASSKFTVSLTLFTLLAVVLF